MSALRKHRAGWAGLLGLAASWALVGLGCASAGRGLVTDAKQFAKGFFELSLDDERRLGHDFLREIRGNVRLIEDPEVAGPVETIGNDLLAAAGPQPFDYGFFVVADPSVNAFAGPAGLIFVHAGLLERLDRGDELAAVLAHEISHARERHVAKRLAQEKKLALPVLAAALAGAMVADDAETSQAIMTGSLAAGASLSLARSRAMEDEADRGGLRLMARAGYDPEAMPGFFSKLLEEKRTNPTDVRPYLSTHPATRSRLSDMAGLIPYVERNDPRHGGSRFDWNWKRMHTRLIVATLRPETARERFLFSLERNPSDPEARLGLALALRKMGRTEEAIEELGRALAVAPSDAGMHHDLGSLLYVRGRLAEAVTEFEEARSLDPENLSTAADMAKAYLESGRLSAAIATLDWLVEQDPMDPENHYLLGVAHGRKGDLGRAHEHLAFAMRLRGNLGKTIFHLEKAIEAYGPESDHGKYLKGVLDEMGAAIVDEGDRPASSHGPGAHLPMPFARPFPRTWGFPMKRWMERDR